MLSKRIRFVDDAHFNLVIFYLWLRHTCPFAGLDNNLKNY